MVVPRASRTATNGQTPDAYPGRLRRTEARVETRIPAGCSVLKQALKRVCQPAARTEADVQTRVLAY
eukprot:2162608-Rhodomonas_salina.1